MTVRRIVSMHRTDIHALPQTLFQEIVLVMAEATYILLISIAYQWIILDVQFFHGTLQGIFCRIRIGIE